MTMKEQILKRLHTLGIEELKAVADLNELNGDYVNLECRLPNGKTGKILDDGKKYLCAEICIADSGKCYGVAAVERQIAVYRYGDNGANAELALWVAL